MAAPDPKRVKCPRCGATNDTTRSADQTDKAVPEEGAMVGDLIATERKAARRRAAQAAAAAEQRDADALSALEKRRQTEQRYKQMGGAAQTGGGPKAWVVSLFVTALVVLAIGAVTAGIFKSRASDAEQTNSAFSHVASGNAAQQLAEQWARRLFPYPSVNFYAVQYDAVSEPREGLIMVKGVALGGAAQLSSQQVAALVDDREAGESRLSRDQIKQDLQLLKDAYDPGKMSEAATGQRKDDAKAKPLDSEAELEALGYESKPQPAPEPAPQAAPGVDVIREPFVCILRSGDEPINGPNGVALDYFHWKTSGATQWKDEAALPAQQTVESVFAARRDGASFHPYLRARTAAEADAMFPSNYQPQSWRILRCDRLPGGAARVFIGVQDRTAAMSGTWIVDVADMGGHWLIINAVAPR